MVWLSRFLETRALRPLMTLVLDHLQTANIHVTSDPV